MSAYRIKHAVTEIVKLDKPTRMEAIQEVRQLSSQWKHLREKNENQP